MRIHELFTVEPLPLDLSQSLFSLGITPKELEEVGITVSVKVLYPHYPKEGEVKRIHKELYETILSHSKSYDFITNMCCGNLEDILDYPYQHIYLWVKIKDRKLAGLNRLIITKGNAPDRREAYYLAKDYSEFWDIVERLTKMYDYPEENHIPIMLKQNNGICGSSFEEWEVIVE